MKKTLVVNLFAGPCAGKTSLASRLFSELNISKIYGEAAFIQEFAKELIYSQRFDLLANQPYVTSEQCRRIEIHAGNVDIIVTDSPVLLGLAYSPKEHYDETKKIIEAVNGKVENINFFIERIGRDFDQRGRMGTIDDAIQKDQEIKELLNKTNTPYHVVQNKYDIVNVISKISDKIGSTKQSYFPERSQSHSHFSKPPGPIRR